MHPERQFDQVAEAIAATVGLAREALEVDPLGQFGSGDPRQQDA